MAARGEDAERPAPKSSTLSKVEMQQLVLPRDADVAKQQLHSGQMLKWIDVAACLAAERHCEMPCVTVSMDGVYFENMPQVGNVVFLKAQVTRAFDSSMEILVHVICEDREKRGQLEVCKAYLTFIARLKDKKKVKLPFILPASEDRSEYLLANERRSNRLKYRNTIKDRSDQADAFVVPVKGGEDFSPARPRTSVSDGRRSGMYTHETKVSSIELVLPQHGNHHQSVTFGGQIMEWMATACFIAASRVLPNVPYLQAIDIVRFRQESHIGDRVQIRAQVNRAFPDSVEVGCRVEASVIGEATPRHINTSFLALACKLPANDNNSIVDLQPSPSNKEDVRRYDEALIRYHMRLERVSYMKAAVSLGNNTAPKWSSAIADQLILSNYERVLQWRLVEDWTQIKVEKNVTMSRHQSGGTLCIKMEMDVELAPRRVFAKLADPKSRCKWDALCKSFEVFEQYSKTDMLIHGLFVPKPRSTLDRDFVLLMSSHVPVLEGESYAVCFRSVNHLKVPPSNGIERSLMPCSGYSIEPVPGNEDACTVVYVQQVSAETLVYVAGDLLGVSDLMLHLGQSLCKFLMS